jgi:four helix bundle protein
VKRGGEREKGRKGEGGEGRRGERERSEMAEKLTRHQQLDVYKKAFEAAMEIFRTSKSFPREETYSLTDQIRRSSRSVCANIAEAWRKRRYEAAFAAKLCDSEGEAAETQTWLEFAVKCEYLDREKATHLYKEYDQIIGKLVVMINSPEDWILPSGLKKK